MFTLITVIVVIASILLVGIVLVQNSKGGGLASSFQSQNQIMGVQKTTDFVEKATWVLVSVVVVLSIASAAFYPRETVTEDSVLKDQVEQLPATSDLDAQE